ncbi:gamma-aminobutyric acid receptor subunit beta-like, partial [Homarus americanus]
VSYPGSHNPLTQTRQYTGKFICAFELYAYPFDVQLCSINIRLPQAYEDYVQFSDTQRSVLYAGPKELSSYIIYNVRLGEVKDGGWLTVEFELHRRQGVIVLATFLPSVLLLLVSWATLFIKLEALNVRAIMSLTTLLVLYTLFSNTSRTLPATATIKLIDVWFLFIIVLLFINIMIHIFITLTTDDTWFRRVSKPLTVVDPIVSENTHPSSVATSPKFLAVYRIIIFPTIVFIFGVTFIVLCYRHQ